MQYIVYDGESRDVRFEGECTNKLKDDGILARQAGPDGPVSIKCSSASPNLEIRFVTTFFGNGFEL